MADQTSAAFRESAWGDYIRRCASRDESALAALYDESSRLVYSIALRILPDEADACEVVLDVYRQIWDNAASFDERRGSAAAWIVILARGRAIDRRRFQSARMRTEGKAPRWHETVSMQSSPEKLAIVNESSRRMTSAVAELPSEQRQVLELAFFAGFSHSEIAERLGSLWEPLRREFGWRWKNSGVCWMAYDIGERKNASL